MANNIQEYVAEKALQYAYAREEEIKTLKRKLEALQENQLECFHCGTPYRYNEDYEEVESELLPRGECSFCHLYLCCQGCRPPSPCSCCGIVACLKCIHKCATCEKNICIKCSNGTPCLVCYEVRCHTVMVGCPEHPLTQVKLQNGYTVPVCKNHTWIEEEPMEAFENWDGPPDMLAFYGLIHRAQKKASIL